MSSESVDAIGRPLDACVYCGRKPLYFERKCHDCTRRVMMRFTTGCELPPCDLPGCMVCPNKEAA